MVRVDRSLPQRGQARTVLLAQRFPCIDDHAVGTLRPDLVLHTQPEACDQAQQGCAQGTPIY
jgi:hypothetical protein